MDATTRQPVIGAKLTLLNTSLGGITNVEGKFDIKNIPVGKSYNISISAIEYQKSIRYDIYVGSAQSVNLKIYLTYNNYKSNEIVVSAREEDQLFETVNDDISPISLNIITKEEVRRYPGSLEDLNRLTVLLPGAATSTDTRNDLIVRGGNPSENFTMIDGIEVPNTNHFGGSQGGGGGAVGMINVDFLDEVDFKSGGFSVKYGDRLSSLLNVEYRDGDKEFFHGKFDFGFAGVGFILEGPIEYQKSSFLISARKSFLDLFALLQKAQGGGALTATPNYTNANLKANFYIDEKNTLDVIGIGGYDEIFFSGANEDDSFGKSLNNIKNGGWKYTVGLVHRWLAGKNTYVQNALSHYTYHNFTDVTNVDIDPIFKNFTTNSSISFRSDITHRFSSDDILNVGINASYLDMKTELFRLGGQIDPFTSLAQPGEDYLKYLSSFKLGAYAEFKKTFFKKRLTLKGGIRYDYFHPIINPHAFSSRVMASFKILDNLMVGISGGLYHQSPALDLVIFSENNQYIPHTRVWETILSTNYFPIPDLKITLEGYYKWYQNQSVSITNPEISYASIGAAFTPFGIENVVGKGFGFARGINISVQKRLKNGIYGIANYGLTQVEASGLDGILRPTSFDFRHSFTLSAGYEIFPWLSVGVMWRYVSGAPYTPIDIEKSKRYNSLVADMTKFNSSHFDAYHRLDIRVDYKTNLDILEIVTYMNVQNVYNRANPLFLLWNEFKQEPAFIYQWQYFLLAELK